MINGVLADVPVLIRCKALRLNPQTLLPNQLKDIREDALARYRITGDFNGSPELCEERDHD